jgi:hypothetical protein
MPDRNFDLGEPPKPGTYKLADEAYAEFVNRLAKHHFEGVSKDVREDILSYYKNSDAAKFAKKKQWSKLQLQLRELEQTHKP